MEKKQARVGIGVMLLRDGKILMGQRHADPAKADSELHGEGTWTMPGGKVDFGEDLDQAAVREVFEETGIKIESADLEVISVTNDKSAEHHFVTIGFICRKFKGEAKVMEPDEITKWQWFGLELPEQIFPPSRKVLTNFLAKKIY